MVVVAGRWSLDRNLGFRGKFVRGRFRSRSPFSSPLHPNFIFSLELLRTDTHFLTHVAMNPCTRACLRPAYALAVLNHGLSCMYVSSLHPVICDVPRLKLQRNRLTH